MMYDELIKRLRLAEAVLSRNKDLIALLSDAANSIEELQQTVEHYKGCSDDWYKEACDYKAMLPRWIPVMKLPPEGETYGDTTFSVEVLGTEGFTYRKAYYNFKYNVWIDGNEEQEWPSITHWMPLPEPPKEETQIISAVDCKDCRYYPPSSLNGKPCTQCDMGNPLMNCFSPKEETE